MNARWVLMPTSFIPGRSSVSESGIRTHGELSKLRAAGFDAFLIGTRLMLSSDPGAVLGELLGATVQEE